MKLLEELLEQLLPAACAGCGAGSAAGGPLCTRCDAGFRRLAPDRCSLCQERPTRTPGGRCAACKKRPSPLAACLAAVVYEGEVARWIQRFKYPPTGLRGLDPGPAAVARALAGEAADGVSGSADLVVPVPLHPARLRGRGFNPAALLARAVAGRRHLRVAPRALERVRNTRSQTGLDRPARASNVAGAFRVRRALGLPPVVWLVDDVVTTGATLEEAARALRRAGARRVVGICAARTPAVRH